MRFALNKPVKIIMLGAGGTGGHVAPHLYRLLHTLDRNTKVVICDGDVVEEKNLVRQNFISADLGKNKAQVLAERYAGAFGLEVSYIPEFIEDVGWLAALTKPDMFQAEPYSYRKQAGLSILIGCVDNNRSRQLCHEVFKAADNLIYIDSGNGEYNGQVVCGIRRSGRTYYKPIGEIYPDVLAGAGIKAETDAEAGIKAETDADAEAGTGTEAEVDKFPTQLSCADAAVSAPQSIVANIMAATAITSYLYNILVLGNIETRYVTFSTKTVNIRPVVVEKRKRKIKSN